MGQPKTVVFDIGNVLLRWDPRNLYRRIFDDEEQMEWFLSNVCTSGWNIEQDRGRDWDEAVALLVKDHPKHEPHIRAFHERWDETVSGIFEDHVALLLRLREAGVPNYCITNFSGPKFVLAQQRFLFLSGFEGSIVSGDERLLKPDPAIYHLLLDRYGLKAEDCVFIDDSKASGKPPATSACMRSTASSPSIWRRNCAGTAFRCDGRLALARCLSHHAACVLSTPPFPSMPSSTI